MSAVRRLAEMTTVDAAEILQASGIAVIAVGATEQHGPHLALQTDARIAAEFAELLVGELGDLAVLCPPLPYGVSDHHLRFAGTISLSSDTFVALLMDVLRSLHAHGVRRVVIVNGHGGNIASLAEVSLRARTELRLPVASMMWARLAPDVVDAGSLGPERGHACESETSLALVLAPDIVRPERIPDPEFVTSFPAAARPPLGYVDIAADFADLTTNGVWGRPKAASREFGERILETAMARAVAFCRDFVDWQPSDQPEHRD